MLHHTRGIVFKNVKYSETSVVATIYTEKFGVQTYMINGVRSSKSKIKNTMLQPLTLLNLVVYHRENKNIQRISEIGFNYVFQKLPFEIVRSSIGLFLIEVIFKSIKEEEANPDLFEFLFEGIKNLDQIEENVADYHLYFLIHLTKHLGFFPVPREGHEIYFDLREGGFTSIIPKHPGFIEEPYTSLLNHICNNEGISKMVGKDRKFLLATILNYYELHLPNFPKINSYRILESVLN